MDTVISILIGVLIFSIIIIFHELGHLLLAKKNGIAVPEFSLGLGPRLCSFKIGETRYSVKLFLIGGMCQMLGEDEDSADDRAFNNKGVGARFSTIFAGPFFNFILAFILAVVVLGIVGYDPAVVTRVTENGAASEAGLQTGDIILSFDDKDISIGRELASHLEFNELEGNAIEIVYERDGKEYTTELLPEKTRSYKLGFYYTADENPVQISSLVSGGVLDAAGVKAGDIIEAVNGNEVGTGTEFNSYVSANPFDGSSLTLRMSRDGEDYEITVVPAYEEAYDMGFSYNYNVREKIGPLKVLKYAFVEVKYWIVTTVQSLGKLVTGQLSSDDVGGPVRIVSELGNTVEASKSDGALYVVLNLMNWAILLSANLGVMNLLPLPALDGGRLIFIIIEAIRRKPISREKEGLVHGIGMIALLALMVFIFFNDIKNLFL